MVNRRSDPGARLNLVLNQAATESSQNVDGSSVVEAGASEYALLKAGHIDLNEYLELSVDRALMHLHGQIPDEQRDAMRQVLRAALVEDPALSALAARVAQSA